MRIDSLKREAGHHVHGRGEIWLYEVVEIQRMDKNEGLDVMLFEFSPVLHLHAGTPSAAIWYIVEYKMKSEKNLDLHLLAGFVWFCFATFTRTSRSCAGI